MKLVYPAALILRSFLEDPAVPRYGIEFTGGLGISSGALYPILHRLEREGLIVSEWEQIDPHEQERPARRYYRLTPGGSSLPGASWPCSLTGSVPRCAHDPLRGVRPADRCQEWRVPAYRGMHARIRPTAPRHEDACPDSRALRDLRADDHQQVRRLQNWRPGVQCRIRAQGGRYQEAGPKAACGPRTRVRRIVAVPPLDVPEEWRPIIGYEGLYEAQIRVASRSLLRGGVGYVLMLKLHDAKDPDRPYLDIGLRDASGRIRSRRVHHLVAEAFIGPRPKGQVIQARSRRPVRQPPSQSLLRHTCAEQGR